MFQPSRLPMSVSPPYPVPFTPFMGAPFLLPTNPPRNAIVPNTNFGTSASPLPAKEAVDARNSSHRLNSFDRNQFNSEYKKNHEDNKSQSVEDKVESISESDDVPTKRILGGNAYKRRNVYKHVLKQAENYLKNYSKEIGDILRKKGYSQGVIDNAIIKIKKYNDSYIQKGKKSAQQIIDKMLSKKSIFTFILRESLNMLLCNFKSGVIGKTSKKNKPIYIKVFNRYYKESVKLLGAEAEGTAFSQ